METSRTAPSGDAGTGLDPSDTGAQCLCFQVCGALYAMDIEYVREIIQVGALTKVPLMPAFVRGVINLRGAVVPVIDLGARFGQEAAIIGEKTCIVVYALSDGTESAEFGLLVDAVSEVVEVSADNTQPPPDFGAAIRREFIKGIGKIKARYAVILEPKAILDIEELTQLCGRAA